MTACGRKAGRTDRRPPAGRPQRASGKSAGRGQPPPMTVAVPMALSECVRSRNRWAPGLASQRLLRTPNRTPRRSRASSSAWCTRRLGARSFGRRHCPSTSVGRPPTANCCPPGVVIGRGVHRPSQARAAGEWWQPTAGPATARSARRNGRACGPAPAVGGAKGARAAAILRTPREDHSLGAVLADIGLWGVSSGQVPRFSPYTRTASHSTNALIP